MQNKPRFLILHDSASPWGDVAVIDAWHKQRGFHRVGYHRVVLNGRRGPRDRYDPALDGRVETGREDSAIGAHVEGYNACSIGICLIGPTDPVVPYTERQRAALMALCRGLMQQYGIPACNVLGHRETGPGQAKGKADPALDMNAVRRELGEG